MHSVNGGPRLYCYTIAVNVMHSVNGGGGGGPRLYCYTIAVNVNAFCQWGSSALLLHYSSKRWCILSMGVLGSTATL